MLEFGLVFLLQGQQRQLAVHGTNEQLLTEGWSMAKKAVSLQARHTITWNLAADVYLTNRAIMCGIRKDIYCYEEV